MARIGRKNPSGFVYVIAAENGPTSPHFHTKVGSSSRRFDEEGGRGFIARFWIDALGLGRLKVEELAHPNAYELEKRVHARLRRTPGCGRSTEVFDISFDEAVDLVRREARMLAHV